MAYHYITLRSDIKTPNDMIGKRIAVGAGNHEDMAKLVERYKKEHPGALVGEVIDPFTSATRDPIPAAFFVAGMTPPIYTIYKALDVASHMPPPEHLNNVAKMWEEASKHFEMSKYLVLFAAILGTGGLVGGAGIARLQHGPDSKNIVVKPVDPSNEHG